MTEDDPDRYVVVEQRGGHRSVFGPQFLVHGSQVLGLGAVEPAQSPRADAVGGAAGRRGEGCVIRAGREVRFRRHRDRSETEVDPVSEELMESQSIRVTKYGVWAVSYGPRVWVAIQTDALLISRECR